MASVEQLAERVQQRFAEKIIDSTIAQGELTIEIKPENLLEVAKTLRGDTRFQFDMLIDVCGVDYLDYGVSDWATESTTDTGYSRAVELGTDKERVSSWNKPRFAAVYHLLSISQNHRIRMRCFPEGDPPVIDSVINIWKAADWFEREAFDLYGILFKGHPDLRRILTDYGFIGHPFRKDFPLIGNVEMRYDATLGRCVYEKVSIQPRILVPKVIRDDSRYVHTSKKAEDDNV